MSQEKAKSSPKILKFKRNEGKKKQKLERYQTKHVLQSEYEQRLIDEKRAAFKSKIEEAKELYRKKVEIEKEAFKKFQENKSTYATPKDYVVAKKDFKDGSNARLKIVKDELNLLKQEYAETFDGFSYIFRRWFYGMGKEFNRVSWLRGGEITRQFIIVIVILLIFAGVFFGLDTLFSFILSK